MVFPHKIFLFPWHMSVLLISVLFAFEDLACSGSFWKKMEPFFASVNLEDTSYLKQGVATRIHDYNYELYF